MANTFYPNFKEYIMNGNAFDWDADTIKVVLVDTADYTYSAAHDFFDDVTSAGRVATATLASKTNVDGLLDAADATFSAVSGDQSEALVIYKDTGTESTSPLILYFDTVTGLPVTPNGGDILVTWNASGIAQL